MTCHAAVCSEIVLLFQLFKSVAFIRYIREYIAFSNVSFVHDICAEIVIVLSCFFYIDVYKGNDKILQLTIYFYLVALYNLSENTGGGTDGNIKKSTNKNKNKS